MRRQVDTSSSSILLFEVDDASRPCDGNGSVLSWPLSGDDDAAMERIAGDAVVTGAGDRR